MGTLIHGWEMVLKYMVGFGDHGVREVSMTALLGEGDVGFNNQAEEAMRQMRSLGCRYFEQVPDEPGYVRITEEGRRVLGLVE